MYASRALLLTRIGGSRFSGSHQPRMVLKRMKETTRQQVKYCVIAVLLGIVLAAVSIKMAPGWKTP
jgi:hypothetical protein